jgi:hypothetical protein
MKTKFYVGAVESDFATIHGEREEVHFLTRVDCVLTANDERGVEILNRLLRGADQEFIRSDTEVKTFVKLDIFNKLIGGTQS